MVLTSPDIHVYAAYTYLYIYIYICICRCIYIYAYTHIHAYIHTYKYIRVRRNIFMYTYASCMRMCAYTYIHTREGFFIPHASCIHKYIHACILEKGVSCLMLALNEDSDIDGQISKLLLQIGGKELVNLKQQVSTCGNVCLYLSVCV